jgi:hypothetical protein
MLSVANKSYVLTIVMLIVVAPYKQPTIKVGHCIMYLPKVRATLTFVIRL